MSEHMSMYLCVCVGGMARGGVGVFNCLYVCIYNVHVCVCMLYRSGTWPV